MGTVGQPGGGSSGAVQHGVGRPEHHHDAPGPEPLLFDGKHDPSAIRVPALVCASFSDQELHSWDTFEAFRLLDTGDKWLYTHRRQKWGAYYGPASDTANRAVFDIVFAEDTDVIGNSALRLFVETENATDADLFVGVEKLDTDGNEVYFFSASGGNANGPVTRGWLRASKRALNTERSTDARPVLSYATDEPLTPGDAVHVDIPLMPTATRFRDGEALRLIIQSWSDPGQWEGGETPQWAAIRTGRTHLHTGPQARARLLLPTLQPGEQP